MADDLQHTVLKRLLTVGSHGMLQKHLFQRVGPCNTAKMVATMRDMERRGLVVSAESMRHSQRRGILWNITPEGKRLHLEHIAAQALALPEVREVLQGHG